MVQHYTLTVVQKVEETDDTVTLKFKQPALRKVKYKAGQYLTLVVKIDGRTYRRPYSIASVFGLDNTLNITVKAIPGGKVSNYLKASAVIGSTFEIMEPMGNFILPVDVNDAQVVCWSAGSGITPAFSILKQVLFNLPAANVVLVYCNRDHRSIIYYEELNKLKQQFPHRFSIFHILSQPKKKEDYFFEGRISALLTNEILSIVSSPKPAFHYLCGPEGMIDTVHNQLIKHGFNAHDIFNENFHNTVDINQLSGVTAAKAYLKLENEELQFEVPFGKSVLDACLDAGFDFPYSCQTGSCTFCKAILVKGSLKTVTHQQPEIPLLENECLLCCGYPLEKEIFLKAKN